jgi:hypothetical protein
MLYRTVFMALALAAVPLSVAADIPWPEVEERVTSENRALARRPGGHNGEYFVVCTLYYTPFEWGFRGEAGYNVTSETRRGLGGRKYPKDFLLAVRKEGMGRMTTSVKGMNYIRYEGGETYGFAPEPTGIGRRPITPRLSAAVRNSDRKIFGTGNLRLEGEDVVGVFGSDLWRIDDTGGGLRKWQVDLYWGEDEPMAPGKTARPKGTLFEYGYARIRLEPREREAAGKQRDD